MKKLREYDIAISNLSPGVHEYSFDIGIDFFAEYEYGLVEKGELKVFVFLKKKTTMLELDFEIEGTVELICDKSLEPFDHELNLHNKVIMRFSDHFEELDDDVYLINSDTQSINIADFIYEFITVAIPFKKLHPDYRNEDVKEETIIYSSEKDEDEQEEGSGIDPRWEELLKLKNDKFKNN